MVMLLEVNNLSIRAGQKGALAVDDLSFSLEQGEVLALVGESGSGKTMAARAMMRLLPDPMCITAGEILFEQRALDKVSVSELRRIRGNRIGMVFQEPMVSLNPAITIGQQMAEGLRLHTRLSKVEIRERCLTMLERIGIQNAERCLKAYPHEFSGGMRQRIMLASVMLLRPALLIADEPTTALDTLAQQDVIDLMLELTREFNTSVLFISHDLSLVARYADKVVVMRYGKAVEQGATRELLQNPQQAYTRQLLDALPQRGVLPPLPEASGPLLEINNVVIDYPGRARFFRKDDSHRAVKGVSLQIMPGETLALVGGSGSGKTTLGRAVVDLVKTSSGQILFKGQNILESGKRDYRLQCQMIFQDPYSSLSPRMRIGEIVAEPLRHLPQMTPSQRRVRMLETLDDVGLDTGFSNRYPHQLSGGQRQRVAIARALVRRPELVIADEPISALDMTIQKQILELFETLQAQYGFASLFISHDLAAVERIAHRVAVMCRGEVVEIGSRNAIFDSPQHDYTRQLLAAAHPLRKLESGGYGVFSQTAE